MIDFDNIIVSNNKKDVDLKISAPIYFWFLFLSDRRFYDQKYVSINNSKDIIEPELNLEDYSFENTVLCDTGKKYIEELNSIKDKYNIKTNRTKYKNCLIQLIPSGLNLDKHITISNVSEYYDNLINDLNKHEVVDIYLHHNEYPLEFKNYLSIINHIKRSM